MGGLHPRRGAQVEDALPRSRADRPRDEHRRARVRRERPLAPQVRSVGVEGLRGDESLGQRGRGARRDRQSRRELVAFHDQRVGAQRQLRRLVVRPHQRPRLVRAELLPPHPREPLRVRVQDRRRLGRGVVELREQARGLPGRPPQHGVHEAPAPAVRLRQLDRLVDGGVRRDGVQIEQLEEPQPERRDNRRIELRQLAFGQRLGDVIERRAALDRPERQPRRQRAVAGVEPRRLGVERAVRVGVLLECPAHDRVRHATGGCDATHRRAPRARASRGSRREFAARRSSSGPVPRWSASSKEAPRRDPGRSHWWPRAES